MSKASKLPQIGEVVELRKPGTTKFIVARVVGRVGWSIAVAHEPDWYLPSHNGSWGWRHIVALRDDEGKFVVSLTSMCRCGHARGRHRSGKRGMVEGACTACSCEKFRAVSK